MGSPGDGNNRSQSWLWLFENLGLVEALFPRSRERGLIEARVVTGTLLLLALFPRSRERGLIEAPVERRCGNAWRYFRARASAASLKLAIWQRIAADPDISALARARPH